MNIFNVYHLLLSTLFFFYRNLKLGTDEYLPVSDFEREILQSSQEVIEIFRLWFLWQSGVESDCDKYNVVMPLQGRIQDLIGGGGGPDRDRPKTAILGPQFCRILVLGPHFWWSGGAPGPRGPPGSAPALIVFSLLCLQSF